MSEIRQDTQDTYVPYHAVAEVMADDGKANEAFLLSLFPDASPEQVALFLDYTAGRILDGISFGMEAIDTAPIALLDAYRFGQEEGYERRVREEQTGGRQ